MKGAASVAFILAACAACPAQDRQPVPPDADLETIRDWAASRMSAQAASFREMLQKSVTTLQSGIADDTSLVRDTVARLGARAAMHSAAVIAVMTANPNPTLRRRLADVLVASGDPSIGPALMSAAEGADEDLAALFIQAVGRLQAKEAVPALVARLAGTPSPLVLGEVVLALARLESKDALPAARKLVEHEDARARERGVAALGVVGTKDDVDALRRLATGSDAPLRNAALRSLGRFKGNLDAMRTLHEAVGSSDPAQVKAALEGLEQAGTKELSPHFLLPVVKTGPLEVRERAAKLLLRFGNVEGVRILIQPERADADKAPGNRSAQVAAGDRCRELGWYEGAIPFYDRALSARGGDNVTDQQVLVALARCYARLKRFDDAKRRLRDARYASLRPFIDDPDFAEMKENPAFKEAFK